MICQQLNCLVPTASNNQISPPFMVGKLLDLMIYEILSFIMVEA